LDLAKLGGTLQAVLRNLENTCRFPERDRGFKLKAKVFLMAGFFLFRRSWQQ
jgi:hypothetical protein